MKPETIADLIAAAARYRTMAENIDHIVMLDAGLATSVETRSPGKRMTLAACAERALKSGPLSRRELIRALASMGRRVQNPDSFTSILSRDPRFRSVGDGSWALASAMDVAPCAGS